jgi:molybdate transport system substrate-binding protein
MGIERRRLLLASLAVFAAGVARADTTDLVVACDPAIAAAVGRAAAAYKARAGVQIRLFPTSPGLIVPQLLRDVQNDLIVANLTVLAQAAAVGLLPSGKRAGPWRNPLVMAGPRGGKSDGPIAVGDPSSGSMVDGPAVLSGFRSPTGKTIGALDTAEVAVLVASGAASAGVMHLSDVRAHPGLEVLATAPDAPIFAAAVTKGARRPNPEGFLTFLTTPEATTILRAAGLDLAL